MIQRIFSGIIAMSFVMFVNAQSIESARKHLYYQRYESAVRELQLMVDQGINMPEAAYWLGEVYLQQQKLEAAREVLLKGTQYATLKNISRKTEPFVFIGWAHYLLNKGEIADARKQMEEFLSLTKYKNPEVLLAVARAHIQSKNGDVAWAVRLLEIAQKRDKKNAALYVVMGDAYRKLSNGSSAVTYYQQASMLDPVRAEIYYKTGLIYKTQKNTKIYTEQFEKAVAADSAYSPAMYELYYHYFYRDIVKAGTLLQQYLRHSDPSVEHQYMTTDYLYATAQYAEAIQNATDLITSQGKLVKPRLYKLIAYSKAALKDSVSALNSMQQYFLFQDSSEYVARDYELMANLVAESGAEQTDAVKWFKKALAAEDKEADSLKLMLQIAGIYKHAGKRADEAKWREQIFLHKENPNNLDLYNWGVALYMSANYLSADSVFGMYTEKYPEQVHGPLWQARCNSLIDTSMELGLAVPHYKKLIEVAATDTVANKSYLLTAYGYLASYEANVTKDYEQSLTYFEKMLALDPDNKDALRYTVILKKWIDEGGGTK
jgi:tetratricopeptide (TPR) repeat protein